MNNQLNISGDTLTEITQYLKFNDLINIGLTNKENYNNIFVNPSFIISIHNLSLIISEKTLKFFEKINKKIFVKNLIIIDNNHYKRYSKMEINFLQNILPKFEINFLEILNLKNHSYMTNIILKFILKLFVDDKKNNLKELHLAFCENITKNGLKYLSELKNLNVLNLSLCYQINNLSFLSELSNLIELDLSHNDLITDNELLFLCKLNNLKILKLHGCNKITDNGLKYLSELSNLEELNLLACFNITDNGLLILFTHNKICYCGIITCVNCKQIKESCNLKILKISSYKITNNGLLTLSKFSNLKTLTLSGNNISDIRLNYHYQVII